MSQYARFLDQLRKLQGKTKEKKKKLSILFFLKLQLYGLYMLTDKFGTIEKYCNKFRNKIIPTEKLYN